MYIYHHMEKVVEECKKQFPVVLVTGPRQVGKITMIKKICKEYRYCTLMIH